MYYHPDYFFTAMLFFTVFFICVLDYILFSTPIKYFVSYYVIYYSINVFLLSHFCFLDPFLPSENVQSVKSELGMDAW